MKHLIRPMLFVLVSLLVAPRSAFAVCAGGAPDGVCQPPDDDCACKDCLVACSGECTASNPPVCTLEDACTCSECWSDEACTKPDKKNCVDNGVCDYFTEGCCCADCAGKGNCVTFNGNCELGTGGSGGAGGSGGSGGAGGASSGGSGSSGGAPETSDGGCGCALVGSSPTSPLALPFAALALAALVRKRRRPQRRA